MKIRKATKKDLSALQDLNHKLFVHDQKHFKDLNVNWPYENDGTQYFTKVASCSDGSVGFVAEDELGVVVGYLAGRVLKTHTAYTGKRAELDNMYVLADLRGRGVGTRLVNEYKSWCKTQGIDYLFVNAFSPNTQALSFYNKIGFEDYSLTKRIIL